MRLSTLGLLGLSPSALAKLVSYNWDITWVNANPDGEQWRPVIGVNGAFPCPKIEANLGDTIQVTVNNKLGNETTGIHFHGLHQRGTPHMDGPTGVSQCGSKWSVWRHEFQVN
jgi:iron transport multicopper oxidase